jgi:hypothetical protein
MGLLAALDARSKGAIGKNGVKWSLLGFQGGYSSPVVDGDRILQLDNGANLFAFDATSGKQLWKQNLGTIQKASPVVADGKIYVGTENGKFFILRPRNDRCEIVDEKVLGEGAGEEAIIASPAISDGRVFVVSMNATYCLGRKSSAPHMASRLAHPAASGPPAHLQVVPTELVLKPGDSAQFRARLFDAQGRFLREEKAAWSLEQLRGAIDAGKFTAAADAKPQAGQVKATVGELSGVARLRVIPPLPYAEDFEGLAPKAAKLARLHGRGRRARLREAPPDGRRGRGGAALFPRLVRKPPAPGITGLAAGNRAYRAHVFSLEVRDLVPPETACRKSA